VVRALADESVRRGCAVALCIIVAIIVAVVLPLLPPSAIGVALIVAVGLLFVWFAIALTTVWSYR